jgi:hypothetical protein
MDVTLTIKKHVAPSRWGEQKMSYPKFASISSFHPQFITVWQRWSDVEIVEG